MVTVTQTQLLDQLAQAGVLLQLEHGRLCTLAPPGAITAELAAHIRLYKDQLCDLLLRSSQPPPLLPRNTAPGERALPLSFGQEGIWFLEQLGSANAYTSTAFLPLRGHLDSDCLEQAFSEIIRRQESLRTTFRLVAGEAQQVIQPPRQFRLALVDLRHRSASVQAEAIDCAIANAANYQYDLTQDLMLRAKLLQLGPYPTASAGEAVESYLLLLTMHHIVSDGWSFDLLVQELATIYGALVQDKPLPYPPLALQYADFARWQRRWLQNDVVDYQSRYWRKQLADAPTQLNLPLPIIRVPPKRATVGPPSV